MPWNTTDKPKGRDLLDSANTLVTRKIFISHQTSDKNDKTTRSRRLPTNILTYLAFRQKFGTPYNYICIRNQNETQNGTSRNQTQMHHHSTRSGKKRLAVAQDRKIYIHQEILRQIQNHWHRGKHETKIVQRYVCRRAETSFERPSKLEQKETLAKRGKETQYQRRSQNGSICLLQNTERERHGRKRSLFRHAKKKHENHQLQTTKKETR